MCCVGGRSTFTRGSFGPQVATASNQSIGTVTTVFVWPELTTYLLNNFTRYVRNVFITVVVTHSLYPLESRWKTGRRLGSRSFQDHLLVPVTSSTVFLIRVLFELLASSNLG